MLAYFFITINRKRLTKQRKRDDMMSTLDDIMTAKETASIVNGRRFAVSH
nr:MAG TPA_asm: hypothetical protein [Caudoviricetes sp.]